MPEPSLTTWHSRPVFVSSTFADMHAERDYLRIHVFDVLKDMLLERRHYLETIDLRHGIETARDRDESAREREVLKVCLDEIERSRPFFVGILGDRYGSVPEPRVLATAARAAGFAAEPAACSVTELEILHGVLESPAQRRRSWFYLRELDYAGMPDEARARYDDRRAGDPGASDRVRRLTVLKERIRRELPDRVRTYTARWDPERQRVVGLESLAEQMKTDLWSDLDRETRAALRAAPRTWQEADGARLDDFVEGRLHGFVEREAVSGPLLDHALSPAAPVAPRGICVTGGAGAGKSSLFARLFRGLERERQRGRDLLVLAHAAGIHRRAGGVDLMLRRWIHQIAAFLQVADPYGDGAPARGGATGETSLQVAEEVERTFASLLHAAAARTRVVVLVDALDQFERSPRARHMTWLPERWPENARLVATAIPGSESEALAAKPGMTFLPVPALTVDEAHAVAGRYYRDHYHREPNQRALGVLLAKTRADGSRACGNPLWVELVLQEMNLLEADDYEQADRDFAALPGDRRVEALQVRTAERLPAEPAAVYGELIDRAARHFGAEWTGALLHAIALGRTGWRESDLSRLVPAICGEAWDELAFAGVRRTLGSHLVQRGAHAEWDAAHAQLRERILSHDLADAARRRHLHGIIVDHLEGLPAQDTLRISESMAQLLGTEDAARTARYLASLEPEDEALTAAAGTLARFAAADPAGREVVAGLPAAPGLEGREIWRCVSHLQFSCLEAMSIESGAAGCLRLLTACARTLLKLVELNPEHRELRQDLATNFQKTGELLLAMGRVDEALAVQRRSQALREQLQDETGGDPGFQRGVCVSQEKVGDALLARGNAAAALESYRQCLAIRERLLAQEPDDAQRQRDLSVSLQKIGDALRDEGKLTDSLAAYRRSLDLARRLAESGPDDCDRQRDLGVSLNKVGDQLLAQGDRGGALRHFQEARALRERLLRLDAGNLGWRCDLASSQARVGELLLKQGDLDGALSLYQESVALLERVVAVDPENTDRRRMLAAGRCFVGVTRRARGELDAALAAFIQYVADVETLVAQAPDRAKLRSDLVSGRVLVGEMKQARGETAGALAEYRQALAVCEQQDAVGPRPSWLWRNLIGVHVKIAGVAAELEDAHLHERHVQACRELIADMRRAGVEPDAQLEGLLKLLEGGGDKQAAEAKPEVIHPAAVCPNCQVRYRFEAHLGMELAVDSCPECGTALVIELFLEKVMRVTAAAGPAEMIAALTAARDRLEDKELQMQRAGTYRDQMLFAHKVHEAAAQYQAGRHREALAMLQELASWDVPAGHRALLELHLGNVRENLQDTAAAEEHWRRCLDLAGGAQGVASGDGEIAAEDQKYLHLEAACLGNMGRVRMNAGNLFAAEDLLRSSLKLYRRIDDPRGIANQLLLLGVVLIQKDQREEALALLRESLKISEAQGYGDLAGQGRHVIQQLGG